MTEVTIFVRTNKAPQ